LLYHHLKAESAEELAMVQFARSCGFIKKSVNPTVLEITEYNADMTAKRVITETCK
jgi:hypothetical protein